LATGVERSAVVFVTAGKLPEEYDPDHAQRALFHIHSCQQKPYALRRRHRRPAKARLEHKWKEHDGFTERYNCDRLVWFETYQDIRNTIAREKQLKGWRRDKKIALIEKSNPVWIDLSRDWYDVEPADLKRATDRMDS
jgi:putative endonuclease